MGSIGRILIADPDSRALSLTASGLRKAGFEPVSASHGEEALALLQTEPSLVLCEASLEGVDGFALCESARKSPATRDIPFLLLARKDENASLERAKAAGADDLLTKPLYVRDVTTLAQLFAGRRADVATLEGDLSVTPLFYVLRALTSGARSGVIEVPAEQGIIHFRDGRLVEASAGALQGEAAVGRLLVLAEGSFTLRLGPVLLRGSISYSLRELVSVDEPRRQRFEKAVAVMGGQEARLVVDIPALARELPQLPASIERIARLFDGQRTLGDVLRACDLDEVTAAETVLRLFALRIIQAPTEKLELPHGAPHLFEPRNDEALLAMKELFPEPSDPLVAQVLPEAPREVRDWFSELGERSSFQELLAAGTGGWMEVPVERAGEKVREAAGPISDEELNNNRPFRVKDNIRIVFFIP
jgi:CheY-like chemotaxis protein